MPIANDKKESAPSAGLKSAATFADSCRASSMWSINESAECLVPPPQNCEYVVAHGKSFYCNHPRRDEIVIRTIKIARGMTP